jgi:hypothetical protein
MKKIILIAALTTITGILASCKQENFKAMATSLQQSVITAKKDIASAD